MSARRRQWTGKTKDSVKRKMKGWAWILEKTGRDMMAGGLSFCKRRDTIFSEIEDEDGLWLNINSYQAASFFSE